MSPEVLERAMDPFFSHQPAGRRRGLGLARVHQWVRSNGGDVRIESQPGAGTTVELRLQTHVDVKR
jgi:signal transduction histidine kinase